MLETAFSGLRRYPLCGHKAVAIAASVAATAAAHLLAFKTLLVCLPLRFCFFFVLQLFCFKLIGSLEKPFARVPLGLRFLLRLVFFFPFFSTHFFLPCLLVPLLLPLLLLLLVLCFALC